MMTSEEIKAWYSRHHTVIALLGLSKADALFFKGQVEEIAADARAWIRQAARVLGWIIAALADAKAALQWRPVLSR